MCNAIVTLIWKLAADRTRDRQVLAFAQRLVVITDAWFTVGGVVLLALGGYGAAFVARLRRAWRDSGELLAGWAALGRVGRGGDRAAVGGHRCHGRQARLTPRQSEQHREPNEPLQAHTPCR